MNAAALNAPVSIATPVASINGVTLHPAGRRPDAETLRELAYTELLRQEAVAAGLLPGRSEAIASELDAAEREVVEAMLDRAVVTPRPTDDECLRYYEANKGQFVVGQALHIRHILFGVTPGVEVQALAARAEQALRELSGGNVEPGRFAQLAAQLSNCPSGAHGGDLGWIGPDDCAPELARELFERTASERPTGLRPRLVHSRFGLHVIEVLDRREGVQRRFEEVRDGVATRLAMQSRATALHQYMRLLVGRATVRGISLEGANSPLVQ